MMANARTLMDDPSPQHPSDRHLLKIVLLHAQDLINKANNSGKAWATGETPLVVSRNVGDYQIAQPADFGKPLVVLTTDAANTAHWERPVDVYELQNLDFAYSGPADGANLSRAFADGSTHSAAGVAFYRKQGDDGQVWARVRPVPQEAATYTIIYSVGNWADQAGLASSPVLREFHDLIEVRSALSALPSARWWDESSEEGRRANREKRQEVALARRYDDERITPNFERFVGSMRNAKMNLRATYGYLD